MFRGLGAGDELECWFPILPIIRMAVFFGPRAVHQELLKVLSEANKSSTVKEPVCGLPGTWETTDVLNVASFPPTATVSKKAGCVRSDGEASLCRFSERARGGTLHRQKTIPLPSTFRRARAAKKRAVKLLQSIFTSPTVLIGVSIKPH